MQVNLTYLGDCLILMKEIPDYSIDMILCDLPYGTTACKWDTIIPFEPLWAQYKRIIKDNGAIVLTGSQPFTSALIMSNPDMFRYEWVWDKKRTTNFVNANRMPLKQHENICVFYKKQSIYNPQFIYDGIKRNRTPQSKSSNVVCVTQFIDHRQYDKHFPKSIIVEYSGYNKEKFHPTQKPVALFEYLIKTYTNEGDLVLDNCAGSGTTGVACKNLNRRYILMEKDPTYVSMIKKRLGEFDFTKMEGRTIKCKTC